MRGLFSLAMAGFVTAVGFSVAAAAAPARRPAEPSVAYIVDGSPGLVSPVNTVTRLAGLPVKVGSHPAAIAVSPDGATAYVVSTGSDSVFPVDTASGKRGRPIKVGASPVAIAITPDGRTAYSPTAARLRSRRSIWSRGRPGPRSRWGRRLG